DKNIEKKQDILKQWQSFYTGMFSNYQSQRFNAMECFRQEQTTTEGFKTMADQLDNSRLTQENLKNARTFWEGVERESPVPGMDEGPLSEPAVTDPPPKNLGSLFS